MMILATFFLLTAVLYASVGFGGGSTYNALLVLADTDYRILPSIALACNLIVVSGGTLRYARHGYIRRDLVLPFVLLSIPMAWIGGRLSVDKTTFTLLLGFSLLLAGALLISSRAAAASRESFSTLKLWSVGLPLGGALGLLAGIVGIGGGVFLAPAMHMLRVADTRSIAATASFFILVNSAAGLGGHATKEGAAAHFQSLWEYAPLMIAVLIGGQIGSHLGSVVLSPRTVRLLTATLVVYVAIRLIVAGLGSN